MDTKIYFARKFISPFHQFIISYVIRNHAKRANMQNTH